MMKEAFPFYFIDTCHEMLSDRSVSVRGFSDSLVLVASDSAAIPLTVQTVCASEGPRIH